MKHTLPAFICLLLCWCGLMLRTFPSLPDEPVSEMINKDAAVTEEAMRWAMLYANEPAAVRALLAHDRICRNCSYQMDAPDRHSAYGAMICGEAVCDGYSSAFSAMMQAADIPVLTVSGTALKDGCWIPHAWNLVELEGHWYHIDSTWDDSVLPAHTFFLCTDEMMTKTHSWEASAYPSAKGGTLRYETVAAMMCRQQKSHNLTDTQ